MAISNSDQVLIRIILVMLKNVSEYLFLSVFLFPAVLTFIRLTAGSPLNPDRIVCQ